MYIVTFAYVEKYGKESIFLIFGQKYLKNTINKLNYKTQKIKQMARRGPIPKRDTRVLRDDKSNYLDKELEAQKRSKVYNT